MPAPGVAIPEVDRTQVADHRPLVEAAGLRTIGYFEPSDWEQRQRTVYRAIFGCAVELADEMGERAIRVRGP